MSKRLLWIIGLLIFVFILYKLDLKDVFSIFSNARIFHLLVALILMLPFVILKMLRWGYLLKMQGIRYDFGDIFLTYWGSMYLSIITPGRIGDFVKVFHLRKDKNVSLGKGFSSSLMDRLFDFLILICMSCVGGLILVLPGRALVVILSFLILFFIALLLFLNRSVGRKVMSILCKIALPKSYQDPIDKELGAFYSGIDELKSIRIILPFLFSVASYLFFYFQCYLIAISLNVSITFLNLAFCISIANIVSFIPISISGIGTRDAMLMTLFPLLSLSKESAIAFSLVFLFVSNISTTLIGAVAWFKKPVSMKL